MRFRLILSLCILAPAQCQWSSISSNYNGTQVYFVTRLQQQNSGQPVYGKLFIGDANGIRALLIRNRDVIPITPIGYSTNAYDLIGVDVASDVSRLAVVATGECHISSGACFSAEDATTTVYDSTGNGTDFTGRGRISPNGQWLSLIQVPADFFGRLPTDASVLNLAAPTLPVLFSFPNQDSDYKNGAIANNGEFAYGGATKGLTLKPMGAPVSSMANQGASARLDASGSTLVWTQPANGRAVIMVANTLALAPRVLFSSTGDSYSPSISSDGTKALFLTADAVGSVQAFLINTDGTGLAQVTHEKAGVTDAMLSGDGQAVIVVGGDGSLLRFRPARGQRDQLIGPTLSFSSQPSAGSPGKVVHLTGTHLDSATVQVNGVAAPVIASSPNSIDFQLPWETVPDPAVPFTVTPAGAPSGWEEGQSTLFIAMTAPNWILVAHQNFEALVTASRPAHPGEVINLYGEGFGPVSPTPATGKPAPNAPLSPLMTPLNVVMAHENQRAVPEVLFAGLAPGTIGYYQVTIRLPASLTPGNWSLTADMSPSASVIVPIGP